jgi:hypothetical protein
VARYPCVVRVWKGLHLDVHKGVLEGGETKSLSSLLVARGGLFNAFFMAAIFVYIVIYLVLVRIHVV